MASPARCEIVVVLDEDHRAPRADVGRQDARREQLSRADVSVDALERDGVREDLHEPGRVQDPAAGHLAEHRFRSRADELSAERDELDRIARAGRFGGRHRGVTRRRAFPVNPFAFARIDLNEQTAMVPAGHDDGKPRLPCLDEHAPRAPGEGRSYSRTGVGTVSAQRSRSEMRSRHDFRWPQQRSNLRLRPCEQDAARFRPLRRVTNLENC